MNRRDTDRKPSNTNPENPKDRVAGRKTPFGLSPDSATIGMEIAFTEGALKYGRYNWRIAGVSASIYRAALGRHIAKWWNGQDHDPETKVHHLDNALACIAIMRDAIIYGKLNDDRPPCPDPDAMARHIDESAATVLHLKEMFKEHNPTQYTIADTRKPAFPEYAEPEAEETLDDLLQEFNAPGDPAALPRIVDGSPYGCAWAITNGIQRIPMSTHSSYGDAEAVLREMLAPLPVNTPEELAELERARGKVVLVAGPGLVDGGELQLIDGKLEIVPPSKRPDAAHDFPLFEDCPSERGHGVDEPVAQMPDETLQRCGKMSNTKRVCTAASGHAGAHSDGVVLWAGVE